MNIIYVDDEPMQIKNFQLTIENLERIDSLKTFDNSGEAYDWAKSHPVDVAFMDIEMPVMNGIELAKKLKEHNPNTRIIFVTAYEQYALQSFGVDAIGYLLKPYTSVDIEKQLKKAYYVRDIPKMEIQIKTMPNLSVAADGKQLALGNTKQAELLALFIDRGEAGLNKTDVIETLWNGYCSESVYWTTMSRLKSILDKAGIADLIITKGPVKCINIEKVDCDLYRMLKGDKKVIQSYKGKYLEEYSWSEDKKKILNEIKSGKKV